MIFSKCFDGTTACFLSWVDLSCCNWVVIEMRLRCDWCFSCCLGRHVCVFLASSVGCTFCEMFQLLFQLLFDKLNFGILWKAMVYFVRWKTFESEPLFLSRMVCFFSWCWFLSEPLFSSRMEFGAAPVLGAWLKDVFCYMIFWYRNMNEPQIGIVLSSAFFSLAW